MRVTYFMHFFGLLIFVCPFYICSQTFTIQPDKASFGIDKKHKIIVWNYKIADSLSSSKSTVQIKFRNDFTCAIPANTLSYSRSYELIHEQDTYKLYITALPLIKITTTLPVVDDPKVPSRFTFSHHNDMKEAVAGIEFRGNISLKFPKKSYDLEFWENDTDDTSIDVQFGHLRSDDDWILDGLYNEPLRLRSYFCNTLWLSIHKPHYINNAKEAKSGIDGLFAEVFLDSQYIGLHTLTEQVDRKLLQLKKIASGKVHGELFKAGSHNGAPSYTVAPKYKNIFPHWAGYEMEYPVVNYKSHWQNIYRFTKFVLNAKPSTFKKKVSKKFNLDNAIDYFLFINLVRATDNLGKNFYVARFDKNTPYFNVPWDLDGVLGTIQDGKRIATTNDILSNGLFDRLLEDNPDNYRQRLKKRWFTLRRNEFSNQALLDKLLTSYAYFEKNKVYEREMIVWPLQKPIEDHKTYMVSWISDRVQFLDGYFQAFE
ncbi:CotH kinase family protein [Aquimarina sp. U1-2]|uniref:CotH kinase family protein n=1 Tax=Aquimarina sp. U1-2 TaxID=2823141 RepID=UPI001AEC908B|nr:CotH kinase family protein [Aquimarina sp. U1-2]MBP2830752.1 CotH kinase family protein [Aquimarina sp. U1-2]